MKIKLFLLGLVVALLAITNPGMEDFKEIAAKRLQEELQDKSAFEKALGAVFENTFKEVIESKTVRRNFFLFSTYLIETDNQDFHYIGIASFILPLQKEMPYVENE